jgi:hypothetical protein
MVKILNIMYFFFVRLRALLVFLLFSIGSASAASYTLTTSVNGLGTVSRNPTNSTYPEGVVVTLRATPETGWIFNHWSGDASGTANPLNVTINTNKSITANFQTNPKYSLITQANGRGSVLLDPPGGTYLSNTVVTATASPANGWVFIGWALDATGSTNPLSITMSTNKVIAAGFAERPAIIETPTDVVAGLGGSGTFRVVAEGSAPLWYQWSRENGPLLSATNATLTLTNLVASQEGVYSISITNAYGSASASARLMLTNSCSGSNVVSEPAEASLRAAMSFGGLVRICCNGTITLSSTIDVTDDVILDASGRSIAIDGNNAVRLFKVSPGVTFALTNLTLVNGRNTGQNGANAGDLPVEFGGAPAEPGSPGEGGAIFNDGGMVRLVASIVTSNSVAGGKGGAQSQQFPVTGLGGEGRGGAIFVRNGVLYLESTTVSSNSASGGSTWGPILGTGGDALGGAIYGTNSSIALLSCTLSNNLSLAPPGETTAKSKGGAIYQGSGSIIVSNGLFFSNFALGSDSPFGAGGFPRPGSGYGGAVAIGSGETMLSQCRFLTNVARGGNAFRYSGTGEAGGGAIYIGGDLSVSDSTFAGNQALSGDYSNINTDGDGGAIYNVGSAVFNRSAFYLNLARGGDAGGFGTPSVNYPGGNGLGGAIYNGGQAAATNCTFALNTAQGGEGGFPNGIPGMAVGGGIFNHSGSWVGMNTTIASNAVTAGIGYTFHSTPLGANIANTNGTFALRNSLVAYPGTNENAFGPITDSGFNISSDGSAAFDSGSSFNFTDPRLDALADKGGYTLVMALLPTSPAIDLGDSAGAPVTDQRGFSRPFGAGIDLGAYEFHSDQIISPVLHLALSNTNVLLGFEAIANVSYRLDSSSALPNWLPVESIGPFSNATNVVRTFSILSPSARFFRLAIP